MRCALRARYAPSLARQDAAPPEVARELLDKHGEASKRWGFQPSQRIVPNPGACSGVGVV